MNCIRQALQACRFANRRPLENNIVPYEIIICLLVLYKKKLLRLNP